MKDPGARALPALAKASQLAKALGAELVLFHAISAPLRLEGDLSFLSDGLAAAERTAGMASRERMERIARRLRRKRIKVTASVRWDCPVYEAIIREACRVGADLIVAERHAGRHFGARLLRLADWELVRLSPLPVLLVKRRGVYRRPLVLAAVDPNRSYGKPARLDNEILRGGSVVAKALRGTLHTVHAYAPLPLWAVANGIPTEEDVVRLQAQSARAAAERLERLVR
jgi:universal stress protein E